jgi:hypothetical protein
MTTINRSATEDDDIIHKKNQWISSAIRELSLTSECHAIIGWLDPGRQAGPQRCVIHVAV